MTRKHYREVAAIFRELRKLLNDGANAETVVNDAMFRMADMFKRDNARFNRQRFIDACMPD